MNRTTVHIKGNFIYVTPVYETPAKVTKANYEIKSLKVYGQKNVKMRLDYCSK